MGEGYQPSAQPPTWRASGITLHLAPTLRPVWHGCPCQEYETPANIALGVTGECKPPHHDKETIPIEADKCTYILAKPENKFIVVSHDSWVIDFTRIYLVTKSAKKLSYQKCIHIVMQNCGMSEQVCT